MTQYTVYVSPRARAELRQLPGHMRQRTRRAVDDLITDPRPPSSKRLQLSDSPYEVRRVRMDRWRLLYVVNDEDGLIYVLAVRKRPPYDYDDLLQLLEAME